MVRLEVVDGDITRLEVDAIVNAANERLLGGGGVDGAIHRAAGPRLLEACRAIPEVRPAVRCPTGEARITPGFDLPARFVIHTVGPIWHGGGHGEDALLASAYRSSLALAEEHELASVAFPAISCGVYGYPVERASALAVETVRRSAEDSEFLEQVRFVAFGAEMAAVLRQVLRGATLLLLPWLFGVLCACSEPEAPTALVGEVMGTTWTVKLAAVPTGTKIETLHSLVAAALDAVDARMSNWKPDSDVCRFSAAETTDWFPVDASTVEVVACSLDLHRRSGGAFDVTVAPLIDRYGFGAAREEDTLPDEKEIAELLARIGSDKLEVRRDPPALRKSEPRLQLNLSAVAKGYAVDRAAQALLEAGVHDFFVEVGGEVVVRGKKADGTDWKIGIERPVAYERSVQLAVAPRDRALATSGDYRNFRDTAGEHYSHTIDPRTGRPARHALASVSVLADTCMEADADCTAIMVLGPEAGYTFALEQELAALFLVHQDGDFVSRSTPAWDALVGARAGE